MNRPLRHPVQAEQADYRARFTADEFVRMAQAGAFDDMKVELVGGRLERMNPPMNEHGLGQAQVVIRLAGVVPEALIRGEIGVRLYEETVVGSDAVLLRRPVTEQRMLTPDDVLLVVEIASTTSERDTGPKRLAYAAAGIPHYWVIDTERQVTHVYGEPVAGDYANVATVRFGAALSVPGSERTIMLG